MATAGEAASGTLATFTASSTIAVIDALGASATSPLQQIKNAQQSLDQAKILLGQNKLDELRDKLGDAAKAVSVAETVADVALTANTSASSSTAALPSPSYASSTTSTTSSVELVPPPAASSSTPSLKSGKPGG
jgi:hypothetical protein